MTETSYPDLRELGSVITFARAFTCTSDPESGLLVFDSVKIDTDYDEEDEGGRQH